MARLRARLNDRPLMRAAALATVAALGCASASTARAEIPGGRVRVGVLTDMSGPFADQVGPGSVLAAQMAAQDFAAENPGFTVEILSADHQNKPDVGTSIARKWFDEDGVSAVVDLPNSGVALAVAGVAADKHRAALASSSLTSDLTGKACRPTTVQWVTDTWAQGSIAASLAKQGANKWYFLAVDYALGRALERDATAALTAAGGSVVGSSRQPLGTTDFAAPLLQAQSSGANVLALASTGTDLINAIKQSHEFGLSSQMTTAALFIQLSDVDSIGLPIAQGLQFTAGFYWDINDGTRAWSRRFAAGHQNRMPTEDQAGVYAATLAYLHAVRDAQSVVGETVVQAMKAKPIEDRLFGHVVIRADGRAVHPMYRFRVKPPAESHERFDDYTLLATIPGEQAFRKLTDSACPMLTH